MSQTMRYTILAFFALTPALTSAYSVTPLVVDKTLEARAIERTDIVITNTSNAVLQLFPAVNNVTIAQNGGIEEFVTPSMSDRTTSLSSWLEISRKPIELRPGEVATTTLTIHVNPDAKPGTYHALISFPDGRNRDEAEALIPRGGVPGTIVTVTVDKKTRKSLGLSGFRVDRFVVSPDNRAASYTVNNTGDTDLLPRGDILIHNHRGEEVALIPVNPDNLMVKAGETVVFSVNIPIQGLIGKYKAYLSLQYGSGQQAQIQDTAFFYAVPWKKLIVLFLGLACVAIALSLLVHRRYQGGVDDDGSDYLPLHVREGKSSAVHHDIDMKPRV